jgi:hypothetical protein
MHILQDLKEIISFTLVSSQQIPMQHFLYVNQHWVLRFLITHKK